MPATAYTHRFRPKTGNAKWEHTDEAGLQLLQQQLGERHFKASYEVQEMAKKADKLPERLPTLKLNPDESPAPAAKP